MTYEETIKHFKSLQRRYTTEHNGKMCEKVALAIEAIEKQIPKKPVLNRKSITLHFDGSKSIRKLFTCPNNHNIPVVCREGKMPYCPFCGQKLDWSDENDT